MPARMDFDIAIIVRLLWKGVPVINLPTRVTYPTDGISHFHTLKDNVRISRTHTLLVIGMIFRSPALLGRNIKRWIVRDKHWSLMAERGTLLDDHTGGSEGLWRQQMLRSGHQFNGSAQFIFSTKRDR